MRCVAITYVILIVCVAAAVANAAPLVTGDLSVYYSFDSMVGGDGTTVADESGNAYDGAVVGNIVPAYGPRGNAAQIWTEGVDVPWLNGSVGAPSKEEADWNYIDLPVADIAAGGDIPTSSFTLALWYKTKVRLDIDNDDHADQATLCPKAAEPVGSSKEETWLLHAEIRGRASTTDDYYRYTLRGPEMVDIGNLNAGQGDSNEGPNWEEWTHFAITYNKNAATMKTYENGVLIGQLSSVNNILMPSQWDLGARIGCNVDDARQFLGIMDEVYIFSRSLTSAEIATLATPDALPGDANLDGIVDAEDAAAVADNWLTMSGATWFQGDFTHDGKVDEADMTLLAANWQVTANPASIPEPGTMALLAVGLVGLMLQRRKR